MDIKLEADDSCVDLIRFLLEMDSSTLSNDDLSSYSVYSDSTWECSENYSNTGIQETASVGCIDAKDADVLTDFENTGAFGTDCDMINIDDVNYMYDLFLQCCSNRDADSSLPVTTTGIIYQPKISTIPDVASAKTEFVTENPWSEMSVKIESNVDLELSSVTGISQSSPAVLFRQESNSCEFDVGIPAEMLLSDSLLPEPFACQLEHTNTSEELQYEIEAQVPTPQMYSPLSCFTECHDSNILMSPADTFHLIPEGVPEYNQGNTANESKSRTKPVKHNRTAAFLNGQFLPKEFFPKSLLNGQTLTFEQLVKKFTKCHFYADSYPAQITPSREVPDWGRYKKKIISHNGHKVVSFFGWVSLQLVERDSYPPKFVPFPTQADKLQFIRKQAQERHHMFVTFTNWADRQLVHDGTNEFVLFQRQEERTVAQRTGEWPLGSGLKVVTYGAARMRNVRRRKNNCL